MADTTLTRKLQIKPGKRLLLLNEPAGYRDRLEPLPDGVELLSTASGPVDVVHLFTKDSVELAHYAPAALAAVAPDTVFWVSYPKKSSGVVSDLTRDEGWAPLGEAGYRPVTQISIDDTWSAVRWRLIELVGKPWPPR